MTRILRRLLSCSAVIAVAALGPHSVRCASPDAQSAAPLCAPVVPRVCGRTVNDAGERVRGARVRLEFRASQASADGLESALELAALPLSTLETRSDGAGEFAFELRADLRIHSAVLHAFSDEQSAAGRFELRRVLTPSELLSGRCLQERVLCLGKRWQADDRLFSELLLERVGSAIGRVLDADGRALAGARVSADRCGDEFVHTTTDARGCYRLETLVVGEHILRASAPGHATRCHMPVLVAHGAETRGLDFELAPAASHRGRAVAADVELRATGERAQAFLVIDARTRAPIEEYGLRLDTRPTGHYRDPAEAPILRSAPGGWSSVVGTARETAFYCRAPGYALAVGTLRFDGDETAIVELARGASLSGRVRDGAHARVQLELSSSRFGELDEQPREILLAHAFLGQTRYVQCDASGHFEFTGLSPALYDLSVQAAVEREARIDSIDLREAEQLDLGEIDLLPRASIEGFAWLGPGRPAAGLELQLFGSRERRCLVDRDGRFRFTGLRAGRHEIHIESDPKLCTGCKARRFELAPGERRVIEIDLENHVAPVVELRVHAPNETALSCRVYGGFDQALRRELEAGPEAPWTASVPVSCRPASDVELLSQQGAPLASAKLDPPPKHGERRVVELRPSSGRLAVDLPRELPESFARDSSSWLALELRASEGENPATHLFFGAAGERTWSHPLCFGDRSSVDAGAQPAGRWILEAELEYRDAAGTLQL
jgi:hypothetical protein